MKTFKDLMNEVAQPLSKGEQNFKALHGSLEAVNKNMVPGVTDQDHIFKGLPRKEDPSTASYENFRDDDESEEAYDKGLQMHPTAQERDVDIGEDYKPPEKDIDSHFKKQSKKMQDAINLHLRKGNSYWDSYRKAKVHVKEELEIDEAMKKSDVMGALKQHQTKAIETRSKQFDADVELNRASKFGSPEEKEKARKESDKISSTAHYHGVQTNRARQLISRMKGEPGDHAKNAKVNSKLAKLVKKSIPEEFNLNEKHLTTAEKKKREEIAKAMERKNPGMDKSMKMAIATSTAKRVAEDYDNYDIDYEGEMAKAELNAICDKASVLSKMLQNDTQLEAWLQSKITKAKYMIDSVYDYMMYSKPNTNPQPDQSSAMATNYGTFLNRMGEEVEMEEEWVVKKGNQIVHRGNKQKDALKAAREHGLDSRAVSATHGAGGEKAHSYFKADDETGGSLLAAVARKKAEKAAAKDKQLRKKLRENIEQLDEKIMASDYKVTTEPHKDGYRPKVVHKTRGSVMYMSGTTYKTKEHAKGHADAYLQGYAERGDTHATTRALNYSKKNKEHIMEDMQLEEGVVDVFAHERNDNSPKLQDWSRAKLDKHRKIPHGTYSRKDIEDEHKRRIRTSEYEMRSKAPVKEETEQLDELSKKTMLSYVDKALRDKRRTDRAHGAESNKPYSTSAAGKSDFSIKQLGKESDKRHKGIVTATKKLAKEETEQLDELSKKTMANYIGKAVKDKGMADRALGREDSIGRSVSPILNKMNAKREAGLKHDSAKRQKGINMAVSKLAKEETEHLDELSKKTLGSYIKKAADDIGWQAADAGKQLGAGGYKSSGWTKHLDKAKQRIKGVAKATDRLTKEELEMDEAMSLSQSSAAKKIIGDVAKKTPTGKVPFQSIVYTKSGKQVTHGYHDSEGNKVITKVTKEELELDEARRGRPRKDGSKPEGEDDGGREHIVMQLRKVVNLRGQKPVEFNDNSKHDVSVEHAKKALAKHDSMHKAADKQAYAERLAKSHGSFKSAVSEAVDPQTMRSDRGQLRTFVRQDATGKFVVGKRREARKELSVDAAMNEALKGDQHKIDANKNGKIDAVDFKILKHKKKMLESLKVNMAQDSVDKIKKDPLASKEKIVLPPTQGNKPVGGEDQVHVGKFSVAEQATLNSLYESLSDKNKVKFEEKIQTEEGAIELLAFAQEQGF